MGDPEKATAAKGRAIIDAAVTNIIRLAEDLLSTLNHNFLAVDFGERL